MSDQGASVRPRVVTAALICGAAGYAVGAVNTLRLMAPGAIGVAAAILTLLISGALWGGLLFAVGRRAPWARNVMILLAFLAIPGYGMQAFGSGTSDIATRVIQMVNGCFYLAAAVLLLLRPASEWFRGVKGGEQHALPNWYPDPRGQHELRWWDGRVWTNWVKDGPNSFEEQVEHLSAESQQ